MYTLSSIHIVLHLSKLPDRELNHLHNSQDVRKHQSRNAGIDRESGSNHQDTGSENQQDTDYVEADTEPAPWIDRLSTAWSRKANGCVKAGLRRAGYPTESKNPRRRAGPQSRASRLELFAEITQN